MHNDFKYGYGSSYARGVAVADLGELLGLISSRPDEHLLISVLLITFTK